MGWAGALNDAFAEFESDFDAAPFRLTRNFRSSKDLVDLQHRFAQVLDPSVEAAAHRLQAAKQVQVHPILTHCPGLRRGRVKNAWSGP